MPRDDGPREKSLRGSKKDSKRTKALGDISYLKFSTHINKEICFGDAPGHFGETRCNNQQQQEEYDKRRYLKEHNSATTNLTNDTLSWLGECMFPHIPGADTHAVPRQHLEKDGILKDTS